MKKVIHIMHYSDSLVWKEWKLYREDDWHTKVAEHTLNQKKYEMECWRPERKINSPISGRKNGIIYRSFPSLCLTFGLEYSASLLKNLRELSKKDDILIHLHGIHYPLNYLVCLHSRKVPIVAQHHGEMPIRFLGDYPGYYFFNKKSPLHLACLFGNNIERRILQNVDYFFVLTEEEKKFLSTIVSPDRVQIQPMGVDFKKFRPMNKLRARKILDLPSEKKIMLYVGRFYKRKGLHVVLKTFQKLKKIYDIELIMIGGSPQDSLYNMAKRTDGTRILNRIPPSRLLLYLNAADVYVSFYHPVLNKFGGVGVAPIESLACGTPIVTNTLKHFPANERRFVGEMPEKEEEMEECVIRVFENPEKYKNCREIARKHYSWTRIIKKTVEVYDNLFDTYYA